MRPILLAMLLVCGAAAAQSWPAKPVRVIVGYPAGGGHDFTARVVATRLAEILKQPFVVENRPGASGTIATDGIAKGPADGYAFIVASPAETVVGAVAGLKMAYDWERDLAPVTVIGDTPLAIAVHPKAGVSTIQELLAVAKKSPGKLSYGTPGSGSSMHFAGESLKTLAGAFIVHIPYRGAAPAVSDLLGGQVEVGIVGMPPVVGPHKAGKIRIVAVTSEKRSSATPEIPAMAELPGFQGYSFTNWTGVFMAAKTPPAIIERIAAEIGRIVKEPGVRDKLLAAGVEPLGLPTAEAVKFFEREKATYSMLAKARNIKADD
ncbi:MAG: tripartite tricarboxylate transporter substrate binding protein [Betaproteobacteria bacterium]|nr:tripartite tricarboxylate transporter substrate binding protein [Betaproteobacteria bacterium]